MNSSDSARWWQWLIWCIGGLVLCWYAGFLSPLHGMQTPMVPDHGYDANIYKLIGCGMFEGHVPYRDLFDQKGPLIFVLYGVSYWVTGTCTVTSVFELAAVICSLFLCYKTASVFVSERKAFMISLLTLYAMCCCFECGGHPAEFIMALQFWSLWELCRVYKALPGAWLRAGVVFGLGIGMSLLLKFNLAAFWLIPCLYVAVQSYKINRLTAFLLSLIGVTVVMIVPFVWYFIVHNAWGDFIDGYILHNVRYGGHMNSVWDMIVNYRFWLKRDLITPVLLLCGLSMILAYLRKLPVWAKTCYIVWVIITILAVEGNAQMRLPHYMQTFVPFASIGLLLLADMVQVKAFLLPQSYRRAYPLGIACIFFCFLFYCNNEAPGSDCRVVKNRAVIPGLAQRIAQGESCVAIGAGNVWLYHANNFLPPIRTFVFCSSSDEMMEQSRARQLQEIKSGQFTLLVYGVNALQPSCFETKSSLAQQELHNFIEEHYRLIGSYPRANIVYRLYQKRN